jgi:hypothetical protein
VYTQLIRSSLIAVLMGIAGVCQLHAEATTTEFCSKEVLLAYFPDNFVRETLNKFNVPQDQRDAIVKELNAKEKDVIKLVDEKAAKLNPNPLKDRTPESRHETVRIFRETILEVFGSALKAHGITDDKQIQSMLADIQQQKAKNFAKCMEKQRALFDKEKSSTNPSSTEPHSSNPSSQEPAKTQNKYSFVANSDEDDSHDKDETKDDSDKSKEDDANKDQNKSEEDKW